MYCHMAARCDSRCSALYRDFAAQGCYEKPYKAITGPRPGISPLIIGRAFAVDRYTLERGIT